NGDGLPDIVSPQPTVHVPWSLLEGLSPALPIPRSGVGVSVPIQLHVVDGHGAGSDATGMLNLSADGTTPAGIVTPPAGVRGQSLTFTLTGPAQSKSWIQWGDGTTTTVPFGAGTATVEHVFAKAGAFTVKLTGDRQGKTVLASAPMQIDVLGLQA